MVKTRRSFTSKFLFRQNQASGIDWQVYLLCEFRLRVERAGGAWCPKQQVERGVREYLQIDFGTVHMITGVQTQGRYDHGRGQEYAEEYTIEYWRPGMEQWKQYNRWDGKQVSIYLFFKILFSHYSSQIETRNFL